MTSIEVSRFWASLPAMSRDLGSGPAERAGQGEVCGCTRRIQNGMGLTVERPLFGTRWAISLLLCITWLRKQSSSLHFWHGQSLAVSHNYWELVNEWVWFESRICRGWLQGVKFWASKPCSRPFNSNDFIMWHTISDYFSTSHDVSTFSHYNLPMVLTCCAMAILG